MKNILIREDRLSFSVDRQLYTEAILSKCFYWYGAAFDVTLEADPATNATEVILIPKAQTTIDDQLISRIKQDLIDFRLREIVSRETATIRELLIAKAFAHYEDIEPVTAISDPVGFDPSEITTV